MRLIILIQFIVIYLLTIKFCLGQSDLGYIEKAWIDCELLTKADTFPDFSLCHIIISEGDRIVYGNYDFITQKTLIPYFEDVLTCFNDRKILLGGDIAIIHLITKSESFKIEDRNSMIQEYIESNNLNDSKHFEMVISVGEKHHKFK